MKITREIAYAVGLDEANRSMWTAGRQTWNEEDYQVACNTFKKLWPQCVHKVDRGECSLCNS